MYAIVWHLYFCLLVIGHNTAINTKKAYLLTFHIRLYQLFSPVISIKAAPNTVGKNPVKLLCKR